MTRKNVRRLFLAVLVLLPLQYAVIGLADVAGWTEPWPAVVLPGFKGVWDHKSHFEVRQARFEIRYVDGSSANVPVDEIFRPIPPSHHLGIMRRQFMPASMSGSMRTEQGRREETRFWLADRLTELGERRRIKRVDVVWYRLEYAPGGTLVGSHAVDTLRIDLESR